MYSPRARKSVLRPGQVRNANSAAVLQLLRQRHRLSRAEISRRTGLSEGTISRIAADLLERGLLVEEGAENSTGGRPAIRLRLDQNRFLSLGAEIRSWETRIAVGTMSGRILDTKTFRTPETPAASLDLIAKQFKEARQRFRPGSVEGVGITVRGLVDSEAGVVELGAEPGWVRVRVKALLEKKLGVPVFVENDVRAAALAESEHDGMEAAASHSFLFVKVGEGLGLGLVLDGHIYRGSHMSAGEIGQMLVRDGTAAEHHDNPGCLEQLASNRAMCERYTRMAGQRLRANSGDSAAQVKRICHAAMSGDETARETIVETARFLGLGIANAVWLLDVDMVIIDGAITEAWPLVAAGIREQFPAGEQFPNFRRLVLRPSSLAGEATMSAAVALPFAALFSAGGSTRMAAG
ncbi:MAG: ROK family protein [Bryobacterales bacterium]|nr:ROK family protein [Bryobacterales bacterium]